MTWDLPSAWTYSRTALMLCPQKSENTVKGLSGSGRARMGEEANLSFRVEKAALAAASHFQTVVSFSRL